MSFVFPVPKDVDVFGAGINDAKVYVPSTISQASSDILSIYSNRQRAL